MKGLVNLAGRYLAWNPCDSILLLCALPYCQVQVFVCCALILSLILLLLLYTLFVRIMKALLGVCQQVDVISEPETVQ